MRRARIVLLWVITLAMAVVMVGPGVQKFTSPAWPRMFRAWGYPEHFYLVIGAIEVLAGIGLLVPRLASACGIMLAVVMAGAAATQLTHGRSGVGELVFMTLLGLIAYSRWPGVLAPMLRKRASQPAIVG
jgi:uncharacterized membrane protein YphA (DoxX/SURF4 family)